MQQASSLLFWEVRTENIQLSVLEVSDGLREKATPAEGRTRTAEDLMAAYGNVFNSELGKFPAVEHLEIDPLVTPVKMPLRKVPLTVQDRLEPELNWLEKLGVIERVTEPTEWISGMVVTEKKNGSLSRGVRREVLRGFTKSRWGLGRGAVSLPAGFGAEPRKILKLP